MHLYPSIAFLIKKSGYRRYSKCTVLKQDLLAHLPKYTNITYVLKIEHIYVKIRSSHISSGERDGEGNNIPTPRIWH